MNHLPFDAIVHNHKRFIVQANQRPGFEQAYDALELKYLAADQLLRARKRVGLTIGAVGVRVGLTKRAVSFFEVASKHATPFSKLKR